MNHYLRTLLCLLLCAVLLTGLCGCGDEETVITKPTYSPEEFDPMNSYHITRNADNTFNYKVTDYAGNTFLIRDEEPHQPEFTKLNDSVLQITAPMRNAPQHRYALFCDVHNQKASATFNNFLAVKGTNVAYLEPLTGQYYVVVQDIFEENAEKNTTLLEGLQINQDGYLYDKAELNQDGDLEITYLGKDGDKTVTVEMP